PPKELITWLSATIGLQQSPNDINLIKSFEVLSESQSLTTCHDTQHGKRELLIDCRHLQYLQFRHHPTPGKAVVITNDFIRIALWTQVHLETCGTLQGAVRDVIAVVHLEVTRVHTDNETFMSREVPFPMSSSASEEAFGAGGSKQNADRRRSKESSRRIPKY
uniref:Uncharacterized protein n=1 Tax=Anopheles atroparvus TaxID=41427 RepID=A0AAG5DIQ4_ANOAO